MQFQDQVCWASLVTCLNTAEVTFECLEPQLRRKKNKKFMTPLIPVETLKVNFQLTLLTSFVQLVKCKLDALNSPGHDTYLICKQTEAPNFNKHHSIGSLIL